MKIREVLSPVDQEQEHFAALHRTGFYGKQGSGCIFLAKDSCRVGIAHRSNNPPPYHVEQPSTWGTVGGALDEGEDALTSAVREISQEVGYRIQRGDYLVPLDIFQSGTFRYTTFICVVGTEFDPRLNWENQGFGWFEVGQWPQPLHFGLAATLNKTECLHRIEAEVQKYRPA